MSILLAKAPTLLSIKSAIAVLNEYPKDLIDSTKFGANGILSFSFIFNTSLQSKYL